MTAEDIHHREHAGRTHPGHAGDHAGQSTVRPETQSAARPNSYATAAALRVRPRRPLVRGQDRGRWTDFYHVVLTAPWWAFFLGLAGFFVGLNVLFAVFYYVDPRGLLNARPGSFWDAFFFSVQTIGSLNSPMLPQSDYARAVMAIEAFCGIVNLALVTGVIFSRFSRPFARIVFSNVAVIAPFNGTPTLMFRAANQRGNLILDATASVSLVRQATTKEGVTMRRFEELKLLRARSPLFALSWTVMHPIDETSPLYGATLDTFYEQQMDIVILLSGMDETLSQTIYARHAFTADDILFDRRFVDVLNRQASGRMEVNLHRFHDTEPLRITDVP